MMVRESEMLGTSPATHTQEEVTSKNVVRTQT